MASKPPKVPNMPTVEAFLEATTVRLGGKLGFTKLGPVLSRDRLVEVDIALDAWWRGSEADKHFHTFYLMESCSRWASKHRTNSGASRTGAQRMIAVENLVNQCRSWIARHMSSAGQLKSLDKKYAAERDHYKNAKTQGLKINPIGGSFIHSDGYEAILHKKMADMTADDYEGVAAQFGVDLRSGRTKYMNSVDRGEYILTIRSGEFCTKNGEPLNAKMVYSMSKYGAIYAKDSFAAETMYKSQNSETEFFNHSSFMSGKDIICAGTIEKVTSNYGKPDLIGLTAITTLSGHYKPNADNLANCLVALKASGLNLNQHVAFAAAFIGENIDFNKSVIMKANDFLNPSQRTLRR